jgi:hypothetical protein
MSDPKRFARALERFERAALDRGDPGAIPVFGQDAEEQTPIDAARRRINTEYGQARAALVKAAGFSRREV